MTSLPIEVKFSREVSTEKIDDEETNNDGMFLNRASEIRLSL